MGLQQGWKTLTGILLASTASVPSSHFLVATQMKSLPMWKKWTGGSFTCGSSLLILLTCLPAYLKIQMSLKQLQEPSKEAKDKCVQRLAKATLTRWLSPGKAIEGVHRDKVPLILPLKHFEEQDAHTSGLLRKMQNSKFIGVVTIMNHILPILNRRSCTFKQGKVAFAHIQPALEKCVDDLNKILQTEAPITEFQSTIQYFLLTTPHKGFFSGNLQF